MVLFKFVLYIMLTSGCQDQGSKELCSAISLLSNNLFFMSLSCITFYGHILKKTLSSQSSCHMKGIANFPDNVK